MYEQSRIMAWTAASDIVCKAERTGQEHMLAYGFLSWFAALDNQHGRVAQRQWAFRHAALGAVRRT